MEAVREILEMIVTLLVIPSIPIIAGVAVKHFKAWSEEKAVLIENQTLEKYHFEITDTITQVVMSTTQTYVNAMKNKDAFDEEAQKIAFEKTKSAVTALLAQDCKDFIKNMYGDMDLWLDTKIEQVVLDTH